jgi:hypothetical protein
MCSHTRHRSHENLFISIHNFSILYKIMQHELKLGGDGIRLYRCQNLIVHQSTEKTGNTDSNNDE